MAIGLAVAPPAGADEAAQPSPQQAPPVEKGEQRDYCPVKGCPEPNTPAFDALDPGRQTECDPTDEPKPPLVPFDPFVPHMPDDWALRQIGLYQVYARQTEANPAPTGRGVVISHIDTGYTRHPALVNRADIGWPASTAGPRGLEPGLGYNFFDECRKLDLCPTLPVREGPQGDPLDRLQPAVFFVDRQPGHGTGTSGMLASPGIRLSGEAGPPKMQDRVLFGIAPNATVVPYRVTDGVILSEGRSAGVVAGVLAAATREKPPVDVITISMGRRSPSVALEMALAMAERNGIIVVAATGEYPAWSPVRFPAQYPSVIGVTGTTVEATPWSGILGAGRGPSTVIAAPAYNVWHAETKLVDGRECYTAGMGRGTSFSSPLVAGAAALWIEKHTRGWLDDTYGRPAVPSAFRYVLEHHGYRRYREICTLARTEKWRNAEPWPLRWRKSKTPGAAAGTQTPPKDLSTLWPTAESEAFSQGVCSNENRHWDTGHWGVGILAVDRLLDAPLPTAQEVCAYVYDTRGAAAWDRACPLGSVGRDPALAHRPPANPAPRERITRVAGATYGRPFGDASGSRLSLSYGVIFSEHLMHAPRGIFVQGKYGGGSNVLVGIGWGVGMGYDPFRDSQRLSVIPGFSPAIGYGLKAAYMRARSAKEGRPYQNYFGFDGHLTVYKLKAGTGLFHGDDRTWIWTWEFGFGY